MRLRLSREAQIGLITAVAAIFLFFGLNYLKGHSVFQRYTTYYAVFQNADNLSTSDKVLYRGYKVGQVQDLRFNPRTGEVLIEFEVLREIPLPIDSRATITNLDLLGTKGLWLVPGSAERLAQEGDTLRDSLATGTFDKVLQEIRPLRDRLDTLLAQLNQTATHLNSLLAKESGAVPQTIGALRTLADKTSAELTPTAAQLRQTLGALDRTLTELRPRLTATLSHLEKGTDSLSQRLPPLLARLDSTAGELQTLLRTFNQGHGTAGLLLRDSSLYKDLDRSVISLRKLLDELRLHPERFVHFSIFGRKNKPPADE
ncbi:MAG: MlaD family protein [Bacteroidia bacterium]|jgi:phospholipid/cholesterol/gamma-HCH transport system substrate-binding protein|nr:MlaD family protein [Bacteroidia bacterium]GIV23905.1 MAG: mammalian cell entry protein [Bacteroidia bacterium]